MRVINLLPWREAMYRQHRRRFVLTLSGVISLTVILVLVSHWNGRQDRLAFAGKLAGLQANLSDLERDSLVLLQASEQIADITKTLQSRQRQWLQQQEWLQQMQLWQMLARDARISSVTWSGDEITLQAVSEAANPVRKLIHHFPDWQLQQIELNARSEYQFVVSGVLRSEVSH
jgi:Tfp pilus assembly protein PilN